MRIKRFNEDLGIDLEDYDYSYDIKGYYIYAKGADRDDKSEGYLSQAGHHTFAGSHKDPEQATLYETEEEAQEFIDELEQKVYDIKFIKASDIFTTLFQVRKNNMYGTSFEDLHIEATLIEKTKLEERLKGRKYTLGDGTVGYSKQRPEAYEGPVFEDFQDAKQYVVTNLTKIINQRQKNLDEVNKMTFEDVRKNKHRFK